MSLAKSIPVLIDTFDKLYPGRSRDSDGTFPSAEHHLANPHSDHESGNAVDISHDPVHGVNTYRIADYMIAHPDKRLRYIISNKRIAGNADFVSANPHYHCPGPWQWGVYDGASDHTEHMHFSLEHAPALRDSVAKWDIGPKLDADLPLHYRPPTIRRGSKGVDVKLLQSILGLPIDGKFSIVTADAVQAFQRTHGLVPDGVVGPYTWRVLQAPTPAPVLPPVAEPSPIGGPIPPQHNVVATVFGGSLDQKLSNNFSAYTGRVLTSTGRYASLPYRFPGPRPIIKVTNVRNNLSVICHIEDVGPWLTDDPYWLMGHRPLAEALTPLPRGPNQGKVSNGAGIDLSMAAAQAIGLSGTGVVTWEEVLP